MRQPRTKTLSRAVHDLPALYEAAQHTCIPASSRDGLRGTETLLPSFRQRGWLGKNKWAQQWYVQVYLSAYKGPDEQDSTLYLEEQVMGVFVGWESKLLEQLERQPYHDLGRRALEALAAGREADELATNVEPGSVIVAIDFEGDGQQYGISELGIARMRTKELFTTAPRNDPIERVNSRLLARNSRRFFCLKTRSAYILDISKKRLAAP